MLCHTFKYYGSNAKGKGVKGGENGKEKKEERKGRKEQNMDLQPSFLA